VPAGAPDGERFAPRERLRRSTDYQRCYREGRRRSGALATLHFAANGLDHPRLGVTVSRKVGGAVVRNRLKRWTRDYFRRQVPREALDGVDLVVHYKPAAGAAAGAAVRAELARGCEEWLARRGRR
jgi:ribonuclease P protein component